MMIEGDDDDDQNTVTHGPIFVRVNLRLKMKLSELLL
jgi:hypothetical protein